MTLIVNGALEMAIRETAPGDAGALLRRTHQLIQKTLEQDSDGGTSDDGIEMGLCYLDPGRKRMIYAGARFSLFCMKDGEIREVKGNKKKGLGYRATPLDEKFGNTPVPVDPATTFYMTTDGLIDQVGGEKRRGFGKKRFKQLLLSLADISMAGQASGIQDALTAYQGKESRRDDVSVIGFRI